MSGETWEDTSRAQLGPGLLIEEWLPIRELGAESYRDTNAAQKPPPNRLHVWWARRPLAVSRAAVLGSVLPAWSPDWPEALRRRSGA